MITTPQEYFNNLDILQSIQRPAYALLPSAENIYNIDMNTRTVEAPSMLAVEKDHKAEVIYFCIDRFADYMDLSTASCIITYTNAKKETYYYAVPFVDIYTKGYENKILFPWCIDGKVSKVAGEVEFAIMFFQLGEQLDENNAIQYFLSYSLNTLPTKSKVVKGIKEQQFTTDDYLLNVDQYAELDSRINNLERDHALYWTIITDNVINPPIDEELQEDLNEVVPEKQDPNTPVG